METFRRTVLEPGATVGDILREIERTGAEYVSIRRSYNGDYHIHLHGKCEYLKTLVIKKEGANT